MLQQHVGLAAYPALLALARAELHEAQAESRGDWSWELAYSRRRPQWGDMVSLQISFDLPWQAQRRQQPLIASRQREAERIAAEREDLQRRQTQAVDELFAELAALDSQFERLQSQGLALGLQRVELALAAYQTSRGDLGAVLGARRELLETRLRAIALDAQRSDLRARLNHLLIAE